MTRRPNIFLLAILIASVAGCSTIAPVVREADYKLTPEKTIYVTQITEETKGQRRFDRFITESFEKRGFKVIVGEPLQERPADADLYVTYRDEWAWDLADYLLALDIEVHDNKTDRVVASATWKQDRFFHWFDHPREVVDRLVRRLVAGE
jgi:hypothetical protein